MIDTLSSAPPRRDVLPSLPSSGLSLWDLPAFLATHRLRAGKFKWVWADIAGRGRVEVLAMEVATCDSISPSTPAT